MKNFNRDVLMAIKNCSLSDFKSTAAYYREQPINIFIKKEFFKLMRESFMMRESSTLNQYKKINKEDEKNNENDKKTNEEDTNKNDKSEINNYLAKLADDSNQPTRLYFIAIKCNCEDINRVKKNFCKLLTDIKINSEEIDKYKPIENLISGKNNEDVFIGCFIHILDLEKILKTIKKYNHYEDISQDITLETDNNLIGNLYDQEILNKKQNSMTKKLFDMKINKL